MGRRMRLAAWAVMLGLISTACGPKDEKPPVDGRLFSVSARGLSEGVAESGDALPWFSQYRITDGISIGGKIYLAVNRYGIIEISASEEPEISGFDSDPRLVPIPGLRGRSSGRFFLRDSRPVLHLFERPWEGIPGPEVSHLSFLALNPAGRWVGQPGGFQVTHPDWELVSFESGHPGLFGVLKKQNEDSTLFWYGRLDTEGTPLEEWDSSGVQEGLRPEVWTAADSRLRGLGSWALGLAAAETVDFEWRVDGENRVLRFRKNDAPKTIRSLEVLPGRVVRGKPYLLAANRLGCCAEDSSVRSFELPSLPPGARYTDFWTDGVRLILFWEQGDRFFVRAAGFRQMILPEALRF